MLPFISAMPGIVNALEDISSLSYSSVVRKGTSGGTITAMSDIQAGDLLIHYDQMIHGSSIPSAGTPSGFTAVINRGVSLIEGGQRIVCSYKIASGSEGSTTITGMSNGPAGIYKTLIRVRANRPITAVNGSDFGFSGTTGNPSAQTASISSFPEPIIVLGGYYKYAGTFSSVTFSPTQTTTIDNDFGDGSGGQQIRLLTSFPTHSDVTIDIGDTGIYSSVVGAYFRLS